MDGLMRQPVDVQKITRKTTWDDQAKLLQGAVLGKLFKSIFPKLPGNIGISVTDPALRAKLQLNSEFIPFKDVAAMQAIFKHAESAGKFGALMNFFGTDSFMKYVSDASPGTQHAIDLGQLLSGEGIAKSGAPATLPDIPQTPGPMPNSASPIQVGRSAAAGTRPTPTIMRELSPNGSMNVFANYLEPASLPDFESYALEQEAFSSVGV